MKALDEYFLIMVFMLLLNRVHVFADFMFIQRNMAVEGLIIYIHLDTLPSDMKHVYNM